MCHALWHRLDLDFMSNESNIERLSAYTGDPACRPTDHTSRLRGARNEPSRNRPLQLDVSAVDWDARYEGLHSVGLTAKG